MTNIFEHTKVGLAIKASLCCSKCIYISGQPYPTITYRIQFTSQGALEIEGELLCSVGTLACKCWLCITSGITSPVCHQPNTGRAEWNTDGTGKVWKLNVSNSTANGCIYITYSTYYIPRNVNAASYSSVN